MDRRHFLHWTANATTFFAAHGFAAEEPMPSARKNLANTRPLILELKLRSAAPLAELRSFYGGLLGLRMVDDEPDRIRFAAGGTWLNFVPAGQSDGQAFYHFAFNIPENKIEAAWKWQKERTPLLPIPTRLRDANYPDDVVNYAHWNAHSIFFFDPAGNVVEYIARHDLPNAAGGSFSAADILYASEIAFVSDDVLGLAGQLKELAGVAQYRGGDENFTALGDEQGLLLVMKRGRVISFEAPEKKAVSLFHTAVRLRGLRAGRHAVDGHPFDLILE